MIHIDEFAGGGGASTGYSQATGRSPDIAINHNATALDMHKANHPDTHHIEADVRDVDLRKAAKGRDVASLWMSPSCTDHSLAGGSKPLQEAVRNLPWQTMTWMDAVRPGVIYFENVVDVMKWGPLLANGRPDKEREGETWNQFLEAIDARNYKAEFKVLRAHDFGIGTIRERLFGVMRCDGVPIKWPEPTHGEGLLPVRSSWEVIDWDTPVRSIFGRKRPLVDGTMRRIAEGVIRQVVESDNPYICPANFEGDAGKDICAAFICKHFTGHRGTPMSKPLGAITTRDHHSLIQVKLRKGVSMEGESCAAFIMKYYRDGGQWHSLHEPLHTITTKSRLALVCVKLQGYEIVDIGMRMLIPKELYAAHDFPEHYNYTVGASGRRFTQEEQIFCCGNSVPPELARVVVANNLPVM